MKRDDEKKEMAAARAAAYRERLKAAGIPTVLAVDRAIAEAVAYHVQSVIVPDLEALRTPALSIKHIVGLATLALIGRRHDARQSRSAVVRRLKEASPMVDTGRLKLAERNHAGPPLHANSSSRPPDDDAQAA